VAEEKLDKITIEQESRVASTIMCVSGGYPGSYEKGFEIKGLTKEYPSGSFVFQAGTKTEGDKILTNGGRVLCVTSFGDTVHEAIDKSREVLQKIDFDGMYYRRDIGYEFMS
ncbi:MAG TPA: phosphoribosylglycinamide synthetase C domain-containing protein, partial [Puia sp.]|nr:phosphoribosylglycinamide synthetase C domain-containing protein [Puia sp.]